jgi:YidC/Oxa1 family membrane protein insertase
VRVCMIPLFMKQLKSQREMQIIGPEMQRIQREYKSEPMEMQKRLGALYKEHGVNPYAGCLPLLVQLPFLWGLYGALNTVLRAKHVSDWTKDLYPFIKPLYSGSPHLDTNFFFIHLASPDVTHILPVLAAALTFVSIRMAILKNKANQQAQSQPVVQNRQGPDPNAASMKMMQYMMPVVTLISASVFPAGLALYWTTTTAFSIGQQYFVNGRNWGPIQNDVNMLLGFAGLGNRGKTTVVEEPAPQIRTSGRRRQVVDALPAAKDDLKQPAPALLEAPANGNGNKPASAPKPRPVTPRAQPAKKTPAVRLAPSANGASAGTPIKVATSANGAALSVARTPKASTISRPKSTSTGRSSKSSHSRKKK